MKLVNSKEQFNLAAWATSPEAVNLLEKHDVKESTRQDYIYKVGRFVEYIEKEGFSQDVLIGYKESLRADLALTTAGSKNAYYTAALVFVKLLCRHLGIDPAFVYTAKRFKRAAYHLKYGFSPEEVEMIKSFIALEKKPFKRARALAMVSLMAHAGFRTIEVVTLQGHNLNFSEKVAKVHGKASDELQTKHLPQKCITALQTYFDFLPDTAGYLFTGMRGPQKEHITPQGLRQFLTPYIRACGIKKTLHGFRHYFVTELLTLFGGDLLKVMHFSGHSSVNAVRAYDDRMKQTIFKNEFHKYFD